MEILSRLIIGNHLQTLFERKNIPPTEKTFFLQKYVRGAAKDALEGYLLISSDDLYQAARDLLSKQYGEPFVIAKAFRDKLHACLRLPKGAVRS